MIRFGLCRDKYEICGRRFQFGEGVDNEEVADLYGLNLDLVGFVDIAK